MIPIPNIVKARIQISVERIYGFYVSEIRNGAVYSCCIKGKYIAVVYINIAIGVDLPE